MSLWPAVLALTGLWLLGGFLLPTVLWVLQAQPWLVVRTEDLASQGTLTRRGAEWLARREQPAEPDRALEVVSRAQYRRRVALRAARAGRAPAAPARRPGTPLADLPMQSRPASRPTPQAEATAARARPVVLA